MKVLVVCSGNVPDFDFKIHQSFVYEQIEAVKQEFDAEYDTFFIKGRGIRGYASNLTKIRQRIATFSPDLIHAHFGLSGLVSCMQRMAPVVVTFHGSDGYIPYVRTLSKLAASLSAYNIFVEQKIKKQIGGHSRNAIVPCGLDLDRFYLMEKKTARDLLKFDQNKPYILFSSSFDNTIKNYPLAREAVSRAGLDAELIELKNKDREDVNVLLNACDLLLLTSITEGSPQIIKEAMACNCPIVTTDVGDVREIVSGTDGCYVTAHNAEEIADKIKRALGFRKRTEGRLRAKGFDNKKIAKTIHSIYLTVKGNT